ncbi:unnamed protein product [Cyclocybe aegerita]|uniref:Zinc-finger domain-containing protein n=1 Tax=Cyclocybe aegerita TaxID=1973307 RepID=A0A8S0VUY7_CYCAE|nr:unnamed protein product [Cyclocybe aegerita]
MEASSSAMADPVSTLRAAALSTLKSKRRKPVVDKPAPVPSRPPPPTDMFQLDYGQEETPTDVPMADVPASIPPPPVAKERTTPPHTSDIAREEGEISEEEEPPPISKSPTPQTKRSTSVTSFLQMTPEPRPEPKPSIDDTLPSIKPASCKSTTPVLQLHPALVDRTSDLAPSPLDVIENRPAISMAELSQGAPALGPDCVRPGLHLTQDEYDTVKDIILDLLGWGVPPDYLIECGLSQAVIYYVFSELNLSLPESFNPSGLVPYTLESLHTSRQSALMPPPPAPDNRGSTSEGPSSFADRISRAGSPPPNSAALPRESPSTPELLVIEQQRRQELMARKAAQASRKVKPSTSSDTENAMLAAAVPTETVDDFLKSLGSVAVAEAPAAPPRGVMEVDQTTASFERHRTQHIYSPRYSPVSPPWSKELENPPDSSADIPPPSSEPPPTSGSSMSTFSQMSSSDNEIVTPSVARNIAPVPLQRQLSQSNAISVAESNSPTAGPRRGVKRPVAADFVDFDPTPRKNDVNMRNERANAAVETSITKRLNTNAGFFNVGSSRRCVIDLSDSEDDGGDQQMPHLQLSLAPLQQPVDESAWKQWDKCNQTSTYPSPAPVKPVSSGTNSPAALAQKEIEIRKMRELIARKEEETRLKKVAAAKAKAANSAPQAPPPPEVTLPVPLKVEDVDVDMTAATSEPPEENGDATKVPNPPYRRSSESATPPPVGEVSSLSIPVSRSASKSSSDLSGDRNEVSSETTLVQDQVVEALDPSQAKVATELFQQQLQLLQGQLPEGLVDVDMDPSSSAQSAPMTRSAHLKQDAKKLLDSLPQQQQTPSGDSNDQEESSFSDYCSPFESYPLLRGQPLPTISLDGSPLFSLSSDPHMYSFPVSASDSPTVTPKTSTSSSSHSFSLASSFTPDLRPLRLALMSRRLDPLKRLCRYEVPGGGVCRDTSCEDVHLSRLEGTNELGSVEPSDQEAAEYLFGALPAAWLSKHRIDSSDRILQTLQEVHRLTLNNPLDLEDRVAQALTLIRAPST